MHAYGTRAMALGATVVAAAGVTACGGGSGGKSGQARVAVATRDFNNPYWASLRDGANYQGKKMGLTVNVQAGSDETDAAGENAKISTLAIQNYSCYGAVPVDTTNIITPLVPVSRKNKPIINLDTQIDQAAAKKAGLKITSFIGSDNYNAGQIAGRAMLNYLGGTGKVIILEGIPGEQNGINREAAFRATTKGKLQVAAAQTADYKRDVGLTVTETLLKANPDINGIFAANDTMALGAAQAVANAGKTGKIKIVGVDGIQEALQAAQSGKMTATVTQYPYVEGIMVVEACQALAKGKSIPKRIVAPIKLIDKSVASKAISSFPRPFVPYADPVQSLVGKG